MSEERSSGKGLIRKVRHRYGVSDPQFRREMSVMLGPSITSGNRITALHNGDEIFPAMLRAIRGASVSITFETYVYWSGEVGREFAEALSDRARAGLPVHVILDWAGSVQMDSDVLTQMEDAGAKVHRYRPLRWYHLSRLNNRTHRKILVVDGRTGFTGGVGIADLWKGRAQDPEHWRDIHFQVEGPVVAQFQAAFNDNWIKTTGTVLNDATFFPPLERAGDLDAHMFIGSPSGGGESMHLMYLMAIAAATESIDLAAAYFVPDELLVDVLVAALERGVQLRILLPGPHIDSETVKIASRGSWGELLRHGADIQIYEPTMLHTKLLVVDEEFVSVGSTNFDMRSLKLNDEASLNIYDAAFAAEMIQAFEKDLSHSEPCTWEAWRARPLRERMSEQLIRPIRSHL
ncbi:MAG: phospholipase D-like domain-containing protein [Gemmatimonadota bacterium]